MALKSHDGEVLRKELLEGLLQGNKVINEMIGVLKDLQIEIEIPEIDEKDLDVLFRDGVLIIRKKTSDPGAGQNDRTIIAKNEKTRLALSLAKIMAKTEDPVVIYGATGTGKRLLAEMIHNNSSRAGQPFICGARKILPFHSQPSGQVSSGTLYLDDLDEIDRGSMAMIRRLVQNPQSGSFRLIVAVNWGWEQSRKQENEAIGWLNQLRSCVIELPDLAERVDEIGALARYHVKRICRERGLEEKVMTPEFYRALETYSWPGNVRELVNSLEQVVLLAGSKKSLFVKDLPNHIRIEAIKSSAKTKIGL